jgi:xylulokinase
MHEKCLLGIDLGTTAIKGILVDSDGSILASAAREYHLDVSGVFCELEPETYWVHTRAVIQEILETSRVDPESITAVSFASQGETLIPVGKSGDPLRKAIVWLDNRSDQEANQIQEAFGNGLIFQKTGQPEVMPLWPANRILWLQRHENSVYRKVHRYLLVEDFIIFKLTGKFCTEYSVSSSSLYLDIINKVWWKEMLTYLGITVENLPELFPSGKAVGNISDKSARETGLSSNTCIVTGGFDHAAGAIGAGNIESGKVTETTGAAMAMVVTTDKAVMDRDLKLPCQCHAVRDKYFIMPYGQTAGMVLKWFKDTFCSEEIRVAERNGGNIYALLGDMAAAIDPGSDGLIMLPHLMGSGSPEFDNRAKGIFAGITLGMTKGHFIRAIMESVACMVHYNLQSLNNKGFIINEIQTLGGASKSDVWNQMKADMMGLPVVTARNTENAALGATILAGVGTGIFKDLSQGCSFLVRPNHVYLPNIENKVIYNKLYKKYKSLTERVSTYWQE